MAKKKQPESQIKLQIVAGKANPAPPVGPALGQHGVNIKAFCDEFNAQTKNMDALPIPVVISVYKDRSFSFVTKTPPASVLILKELGLKKGSQKPGSESVGELSLAGLENVAKIKMPDLSAFDINEAMRIIAGTARSMGIRVEEQKGGENAE